jgi:hypothetical protein
VPPNSTADYGAVARSPVAWDDFEDLKRVVGFTDRDQQLLLRAGELIAPRLEELLGGRFATSTDRPPSTDQAIYLGGPARLGVSSGWRDCGYLEQRQSAQSQRLRVVQAHSGQQSCPQQATSSAITLTSFQALLAFAPATPPRMPAAARPGTEPMTSPRK